MTNNQLFQTVIDSNKLFKLKNSKHMEFIGFILTTHDYPISRRRQLEVSD